MVILSRGGNRLYSRICKHVISFKDRKTLLRAATCWRGIYSSSACNLRRTETADDPITILAVGDGRCSQKLAMATHSVTTQTFDKECCKRSLCVSLLPPPLPLLSSDATDFMMVENRSSPRLVHHEILATPHFRFTV